MQATGLSQVHWAGLMNQVMKSNDALRFGKKNPDQKPISYDEGDFFRLAGQPENQDLIENFNQILMEHWRLTTPMLFTVKVPYSFPADEYRYFVTADQTMIRVDKKSLDVYAQNTTVQDVEADRVKPKQTTTWTNVVTVQFSEQGQKYAGRFSLNAQKGTIEYTYKLLP